MIIEKMSQIIVASLFVGKTLTAGVVVGGSGPPAKSKNELMESIMTQENVGGIYATDNGIGLGINGELKPELTITHDPHANGIVIPEIDFSSLSLNKGNIDVESLVNKSLNQPSEALTRSYKIEDGTSLGTVILKDRLAIIRAGVKVDDSKIETKSPTN